MNSTAIAGDRNVQAKTAQVIPFRFEAREIRTMLIDEQPWFVAADVAAALEYREAEKMTRWLDDDEKAPHIVGTPGGDQRMTMVNESGLYSAILRSRKAEAKRFKKWITAEVLPAIRKHGRYEDRAGRMNTLLGETIGTDGFHMLGSLIKGKVSCLPAGVRRQATMKIWSQTHAAFGVRSAADIPAEQLDSARNFISAYAIEGEWMGKGTGFAGIIGRQLTPTERWMVYTDGNGKEQYMPIQYDACVLTHRDLIKGMLTDIPVSIEEMFEFAMAALANLKGRCESQSKRLN